MSLSYYFSLCPIYSIAFFLKIKILNAFKLTSTLYGVLILIKTLEESVDGSVDQKFQVNPRFPVPLRRFANTELPTRVQEKLIKTMLV